MKILSLLLPLLLLPLHAQDAKPPEAPPAAGQDAFAGLPEEQRKEFAKHVIEASRLFKEERIFESLEALEKAEEVFTDHPELHKLRGGCYVHMRAFDKATASLEKALELSPKDPGIRFNYAEVFFVTKQWQKSNDLFQALLADIPEGDLTLAPLVQFKIMLSKKKLGEDKEALALAGKYGEGDDTPYHYFAKAALAYDADNIAEAEGWIARAGRVFQQPGIIAPWVDTLTEYGYIKGVQLDAEPDGEDAE